MNTIFQTEYKYNQNDIITTLDKYLSSQPEYCNKINNNYKIREQFATNIIRLSEDAFINDYMDSLEIATKLLATIYDHDLSSRGLTMPDSETQPLKRDAASILERNLLYKYKKRAVAYNIDCYPKDGCKYVRWFKDLFINHSSSSHPFYDEYLPFKATKEDIKFYLTQETNLDPKFDDILALMQIGRSGSEKLEIAKNYWDEMGNGDLLGVHSALFNKTLDYFGIDNEYISRNLLPEALMSGNLSACLVMDRRHYFRAVGYFGVTEYMAPKRFKQLLVAWKRNNLKESFAEYHKLHITIDAIHGNDWLNKVIAPIIDSTPDKGKEIAEGALLRMESSNDYLDALIKHLENKFILADIKQ